MVSVCNSLNCTGCGACINICPQKCLEFYQSDEGFYYPSVNTIECIDCGLCKKTCPEISKIEKRQSRKTYAAFSKDKEIRERSSSGGLFSVLASYVIRNGGVVYGASFDNNLKLSHIKAETLEELSLLRGSKYVQSVIVDVYKEIKNYIDKSRLVLFAGTPCQVAGILSYIKKNKNYLVTIDVICHGVPSPKAFEAYLHKLTFAKPDSFVFRDYKHWGYALSLVVNGKVESLREEKNVYLNLFLRGELSRESCYRCQYARNERISDITLGDFWGIGKDYSYVEDTSSGVNLVLLNTKKGEELFMAISNEVQFESRNFSEASKYNSQLNNPPSRPANRDNIYKVFYTLSLKELYFMNLPFTRKVKYYLKNILNFKF